MTATGAAASGLHAALLSRLWDAERGRFLPRDLRAGRLVDRRTVLALAPPLDPELPTDVAGAVAAQLGSPHFHSEAGIGVASADLLGAEFSRRRYGRGPVWAHLNWLLARGLRQHGLTAEAARLEATTLQLAERGGIREYFDPLTGEGRGSENFSWTAATLLDILRAGRT